MDAHGEGPPIIDGAADCGISPHELVPDVIETVIGSLVEILLAVLEKLVNSDSILDSADRNPLLVDIEDGWDAVSEAMSPRVMMFEPLATHSKLLF